MDNNMATDDLQLILDKIGPFFIVHKVRQVNNSWIITGALLSESTEQDLTESMKGSDYTIVIRKNPKSLDLFFEKFSCRAQNLVGGTHSKNVFIKVITLHRTHF